MLALLNKLRHPIRLYYVEYLSLSKAANEKIESPAVSQFNQWATHPRDRKTNEMGVQLGSKVWRIDGSSVCDTSQCARLGVEHPTEKPFITKSAESLLA
ncbi:hypothetical protein FOXB_15308 [Fusarium oxysporum f. sp. conglutinans Fo5176]|uniref:Uncharacterized protein n=1 Tax=Fusarium oxysporum (strain Fo5176) TaxID=660025 RepID=F9G9H6_FUSOF|nr:hypothetical protein FOXB_15308 [Fusarium oxysporum f. sp. conglutinans Fo5176]